MVAPTKDKEKASLARGRGGLLRRSSTNKFRRLRRRKQSDGGVEVGQNKLAVESENVTTSKSHRHSRGGKRKRKDKKRQRQREPEREQQPTNKPDPHGGLLTLIDGMNDNEDELELEELIVEE